MISIRATFTGALDFPDGADLRRAAARAAMGAASAAYVRSRELVPVRTGFLRSTGGTAGPKRTADGAQATISYVAPYAAAVHETPRNYRNGQWKYLETAMQETDLASFMSGEFGALSS